MKYKIMSDLHLEFYDDKGKEFISSLITENVDVLVLAGDITIPKQMRNTLSHICKHFKNSQILYVMGNHDHMEYPLETIEKLLYQVSILYPNFTWLENQVKVIPHLNENKTF